MICRPKKIHDLTALKSLNDNFKSHSTDGECKEHLIDGWWIGVRVRNRSQVSCIFIQDITHQATLLDLKTELDPCRY